MVGHPPGLGRREFLAAGGVSLVPWSGGVSRILPKPRVAWTFGVPEDSLARVKEVTREGIYVTSDTALYALTTGGELQWTLPVDGDRSNVRLTSADENTLYVGVGSEAIFAVDRETGDVRWRRGGDDGEWRYAVPIGDIVFALDDRLAALSVADGRVQWEFDTAGDGFHEPAVGAGVVVAGTWDGVVHAVDAATGSEQWSFERPYDHDGRTELQPVDVIEPESSDALVLVWDRLKGRLSALKVADGSERWRFESEVDSFVFPGVLTDEAVFSVDGQSLVALDPADGTLRWRFEADESLGWPTAVGDDAVYVSGSNGTLYACSKIDGTERWTFSTGTDGVVTNRSVGDVLVADDWNGTCYALDPADGDLLWSFEYGSETAWFPQAVDGTVYFGTGDGVVYALEHPPETVTNWLRQGTVNADPAVLGGGLLAGGIISGGLLVGGARRLRRSNDSSGPPTWNDFELFDRLGKCDAATVFEARAPDGEQVVLKRFTDAKLDSDFTDVIETWADLDHDGVLPVREWGTDPNPWAAMEVADGGNLAVHLDDLDREDGVEVVSSVAEVVHRTHREGAAHGRLHPGNVLFADHDREEILVGDWLGAATRAELPRGYAAPEQQTDEGDDEKLVAVDIYQLGCLAVHVLTGEPPSDGEFDGDRFAVELAEVLETALASDPGERYDSALQFRDMLRWAALQT